MDDLKLKGKVIHKFEVETRHSTLDEINYFKLQKIIILSESLIYTIIFYNKNLNFLVGIYEDQEVELDVTFRGRMWTFDEKTYLLCKRAYLLKIKNTSRNKNFRQD